MIEHHVIIAKMLKERLEAKEDQKEETIEIVKLEDIDEEDFSFKTANETKFKFVDDSQDNY